MRSQPSKKAPVDGGAPARQGRDSGSREILLQVAGEILSEKNVLEISLGEIAARSGLNSALVAYYFGNKDGLLLALAERDAADGVAGMARLMEKPIPADEKLRIHISGMINAYYRTPYLNRLLHHLMTGAENEAKYRVSTASVQRVADAHRALLEQGEREGVFRHVDPILFYFNLSGACDYIFHAAASLKHLLGIEGVTDELRQNYTAHVTEACLRALRPDSGEDAASIGR